MEVKGEANINNISNAYELTKSKQVKFLTVIKQVEQHIKESDRVILVGNDIGAYGFYFSNKGYDVTVVEYFQNNVDIIRKNIDSNLKMEVFCGNPVDLNNIEDKSCDIILWLGPAYHLTNIKDRDNSIIEMKRICKANGKIFFMFKNNYMHIATELMCNNDFYLQGSTYNKENFKVSDFPFAFYTLEAMRNILKDFNIISEIAADGLSKLLAHKINKMDDESFRLWLKYHLYTCDKVEFLGASNTILFVLENKSIDKIT